MGAADDITQSGNKPGQNGVREEKKRVWIRLTQSGDIPSLVLDKADVR